MQDRGSERRTARLMVESAVALIGVACVATAVLAHQPWLDRHFLPSFFVTRRDYVMRETVVRITLAVLGVLLVMFVRPRLGRFVARSPAIALGAVLAAVLALGASEFVLRHVHLRPAEWLGRDQEPRRQPDPRLGWTFVPFRSGQSTIGGRVVDYTFDAAGYRVGRPGEPVDPARPTILFMGESVMFGTGLAWEETVPAQVGVMTGTQSANLAVDGFSTDQSYLRLETELPRFRQPVAVVAIFMTTLFGRNLDDDRPHLAPGLVWRPGVAHGRLRSLVQLVAPYRSRATVERGITVTREVLRATAELATARGAVPLVLIPHFGPEDQVEQTLRQRIFDEAGLPYVLVGIDPAWRVPGDVHPNARAAHEMATAIVARLTKS